MLAENNIARMSEVETNLAVHCLLDLLACKRRHVKYHFIPCLHCSVNQKTFNCQTSTCIVV